MTAETTTPYEVAREGDFPTREEFERVWRAIHDANESGIERLLRRVCGPMVDSYESGERLTWTFEEVGVLAAKTGYLVEQAEYLLTSAKRLQELVQEVGEAVDNDWKFECGLRFDRYGSGEYEPSEELTELQLKRLITRPTR